MGRIASDGSHQYSYDALGQLTTVKDSSGNTLESYSYDGAGNLLNAIKNGTSHTYSYGDSDWKDLLTSYDGQSITYDAIGNPLNYLGSTLTWQNGRQLAAYSNAADNLSISYSYDVNGLRTEKAVTQNGVTTNYEYLYDGSMLLQERIGTSKILNFLYTVDGTPYALEYSTDSGSSYTTYYYLTNLQGDIISILNSSGTAVVTYSYDSWGDITNTTGTLAATFGTDNPLRYRGYCYDDETELYYVTSRYYNPEVGRFLNADNIDYLGADGSLTGYNLFAYCGNNPVTRADYGGNFWHIVIGAAVGGIISAISSIVGQVVSGNDINWGEVAVSAASGALSGAINAACPGMGALTTGLVQGLIGAGTYAATELVNGRMPTVSGTLAAGITSGILAGGAKALSNCLSTTKLYRSVCSAEADSFSSTGMLSEGSGQMEGKFFATTKANARTWGAKLGNDKIISIRVPKTALKNSSVTYFQYIDAIEPAYHFSDLAFINSVLR